MRSIKHTQMIQPSWLHSRDYGIVALQFNCSLGREVYEESGFDNKKDKGILYAKIKNKR